MCSFLLVPGTVGEFWELPLPFYGSALNLLYAWYIATVSASHDLEAKHMGSTRFVYESDRMCCSLEKAWTIKHVVW